MTCTPDLNTIVSQLTTAYEREIREQIAPYIAQRDQLAAEVIRLRAEVRFLTGRLMFEAAADSAHDPDHGVCPPFHSNIEEDH